jgi:hypothetical protein
MIERRQRTDAHEFLGADVDRGNASVVMKMRNNCFRHGLDGLQGVFALASTIAAPDAKFQESIAQWRGVVKKPQIAFIAAGI